MIGTIDVDVQAVIEMGDKVIEDWVDIEPPAFSLGNALMKLYDSPTHHILLAGS